jgi:hypothetical protein
VSACTVLTGSHGEVFRISGEFCKFSSDNFLSRTQGPASRYVPMVLCSSNLVLILPQPFLTPVPPIESEVLAKIALPFGYIIGSLRTVLILALGLAYVALVRGVCLALVNIMFLSKNLQALMSPGSCSTIIPISNRSPHIYNLSPYSPAGWRLVDTSGARDPETRASHHFPCLFVVY